MKLSALLLIIWPIITVLVETAIIVIHIIFKKIIKNNPQIINKNLPSLVKMLLYGFFVPTLSSLIIWAAIEQPWAYSNITNRDVAFILLILAGMIGIDIYVHIKRKKAKEESSPSTNPWYKQDWFVRTIAFLSAIIVILITFITTTAIEKNNNVTIYGTETSTATILLKKEPKIEIEQIDTVVDLKSVNYTITPKAYYESITLKIEFWTRGSTLIMEETITHKEAMLLRPYTYTYNIADKLEPEEIANIGRIVIKLIEYK